MQSPVFAGLSELSWFIEDSSYLNSDICPSFWLEPSIHENQAQLMNPSKSLFWFESNCSDWWGVILVSLVSSLLRTVVSFLLISIPILFVEGVLYRLDHLLDCKSRFSIVLKNYLRSKSV